MSYLDALQKYVEAFNKAPLTWKNFEREKDRLDFYYEPEDGKGFSVDVIANPKSYLLSCEGWHEEFQQEDMSDDAFAQQLFERLQKLLDGRATLVITKTNGRPYKWELFHEYEPGKTESLSMTGLIFFNYFGKRSKETRVNTILQNQG